MVAVSVAITPVNATPTATATVGTPDAVTGVVVGSVPGSDGDGDSLSYSGSAATSKGTVVVSADGGFTHTPTVAARHAAASSAALWLTPPTRSR